MNIDQEQVRQQLTFSYKTAVDILLQDSSWHFMTVFTIKVQRSLMEVFLKTYINILHNPHMMLIIYAIFSQGTTIAFFSNNATIFDNIQNVGLSFIQLYM